MSYNSQFNGKRSSRYRDSSDRSNSFERKRFRGNGVVHRAAMNDMGTRKNYDIYDSNERFGSAMSTYPNTFHRGMRRSHHHHQNDSKGRFDDSRQMDYVPRHRASNNHMPDSDIPKPSRILGAFGLAPRTEERHLFSIMKKYGEVEEVKILRDSVSTRSRGFGFIYFQNIEDAVAARRSCSQGLEIHGKIVRIDYSYTKGPYKPTPGMYLGSRDNNRFQSNRSNMGGRHSGGFESRRRSPIMFTNNNNNRPFNNRQDSSSSFYRSQHQRRFMPNNNNNHHPGNFYPKRRDMHDDDRSSSRSPIQFHHRLMSKRQCSPTDNVHSYHRPRSSRTDKRMYDVGGAGADLMVAGMDDDQSPASR